MPRHFGLTCTTLAVTVVPLLTVATGPSARAQARLPYSPIPVDCHRACLQGLVDQYLAAVVAHDPKRLPLSADVRYTENDQVMAVGDGFWGTATAIGGKGYYPFADTCLRRENGTLTASAPPNKNLPAGGFDAFALPCKKQLESGYYAVATRIHSRRFPIVDEERGLVEADVTPDARGHRRRWKGAGIS